MISAEKQRLVQYYNLAGTRRQNDVHDVKMTSCAKLEQLLFSYFDFLSNLQIVIQVHIYKSIAT